MVALILSLIKLLHIRINQYSDFQVFFQDLEQNTKNPFFNGKLC
jgi:hypothetical protein